MAVGTGMGLDVSKLDKELDRLDKKLDALIKKGEKTEKAFETMFQGASTKKLLDHLDKVQSKISDISKLKDPMKWDSKSLVGYIDQVNKLLRTIEKANTAQGATPIKIIQMEDLMAAKKELQTMLREVKALEKAQAQRTTSRNQTYSGALKYSDNANTLEKERQAIENLKVARDKLKQSDADYANKLNRLNEAILKHEKHLRDATKTNNQKAEEDEKAAQRRLREEQRFYKELGRLRREAIKEENQTYEGAIAFSSTAKTLNQEIQAVKNLEAARAKLNKTDEDYQAKLRDINNRIAEHNRNIDQATGRAKNLERQHQRNANQMMTLQSLAGSVGRALAGMFGVQAIRGYVNKLIQIRGEFELQHKSLQVLIGDIDKANELWDKTVALAVKSPFRVKDLVTYTKQLAAYRVEADKLYDTNKMLADVSAGLGVDMNRLILAFGQVKAANFLRGTELRQFSEAGVNMLEELSKRYTELEGRMVSVGEVFERVSKRMVSFSDVEAVFETITSEGGSFYRMQEKQSETLRGMVMNLKDSIDLMFNEIGESNEGLLKGAISRVRDLVENWQSFVTVLQEVGVAFVAMKLPALAKSLGSLGTSAYVLSANITKAGLSTAVFGKGVQRLAVGITSLTKAMLKNPLFVGGTIAAGLLLVVHQFMRHNKEVAELNKKYDELSVRESNRLKKLEDLAEKAKAYNENIEESKEILSKSAKGTEEYANAEKKLSEARSSNQQLLETIKKDYPQIYDSIKKNTDGTIDLNAAIEAQNKLLVANIAINEQAKGGMFFDDVATNAKEATVALVDQYNAFAAFQSAVTSKETNLIGLREIGKISEEQFEKLNGYLKQLSSVQSANEANTILGAMAEELRGNRDAFNSIIKPIENAKNAWAGFGIAAATTWDNLKGNLDRMYPSLMHFVNTAKQFTPDTWQQEAARNISASLDAFGIVDENLLAKVRNYIESMEDIGELTWELPKPEYTEADLKDWRKVIWDAIKDVNESLGDDLGQNRVVISLQDMIELDKENIFKNLSEQVSTAAKNIDDTIEAGLIPTQERFSQAQIDAAKSTKPLIKSLSDLLAIVEKSSSGSGKDEVLEKLKNRINLIKEMNKEYEKLNKTFSKAESLAKVQKAYADTAKELGLDTSTMSFTDEGTIKSLEALLGKPEYAANKYVIELQKALDNYKVELGIETKKNADDELKKQIEDMLDQYDLSLELKKLNIPPDVAKSLFGVESIGLEDVRKKVQQELNAAKLVGGNEDRIKQLEKDLEKINDMEDKAQIERLQTYLKYTRAAIGERAKIKAEELTKLKEIEDTFRKAEQRAETEEDKKRIREQKALAKSGVRREANEAMSKMEWEEFRKSETFISLFDDLEGASDAILKQAIEDLDKFKKEWKDLPLDQMKEVIELRNKAQRALESKESPWGEAKRLKGLISTDGRTREQSELDSYNAEQEKARLEKELEMIGLINQKRAEGTTNEELKIVLGKKYSHLLDENVNLVDREKKLTEDLIPAQDKAIDRAQERIQNEKDLIDAYKKQEETLREIQGMANDLYDSFKELSEALGGDEDGPAAIFADMGMSMANSVLNAIMLSAQLKTIETGAMAAGTALNTAMGVIGWIVMGVQLLTQIISAIAKMKDNQIVAQLEEQTKLIERQRDIYEQIKERVEKAYSVGQLEAYSKELEKTVDLEIQALEASIALEKSRKKSDEEQIATWEEEILDARKRLAESTQEMMEEMGGIFDLSDFASGFVDAWWDAMEEGKSGLDALREHFDETMTDMVKKQALYKGASKIMEQLQKAINAGLEEDYSIDQAEWDAIVDAANKANIDLDKFLEGYRALFGQLSLGGEGGLSGLSKGIQGITEDTAQIIEAYLNSIRAYTSEQVEYTKKIYNMFYAMTMGSSNGLNVRLIS